MNKLLKTMLFTAFFLTIPSCASYRNVTLQPCIPEEKEENKTEQKITNYSAKPDGSYAKQIIYPKVQPDPDEIRVKYDFMKF